jgi:hypothetical protein
MYVHKIVQLQFDLPPNTRTQLQGLLAKLAAEPGASGAGAAERSPPAGARPRLMRVIRAALRLLPGGHGRDRQRLARVRADLDRSLAEGAGPVQLAGLCERASLDARQAQALIRERRLLQLMNDAQLLRDAYDEVGLHLSPYPRSLKRFLNHVRILSAIAHARGVLGDAARVTTRHVARWAALKERWPLTAAALLQRPARLLELEHRARADGALGELLESWGGESWEAGDLAAFLTTGTVSIGELAEQLVQLVPAPVDEPLERVPPISMRTTAQGSAGRDAGTTAKPARTA